MINYLSQYEDTDIVRINIEFYSDIRVMDMWEYFWRNGVNMSRFENDKEYSIQCVTEYHDYESELSEKIEAQMLEYRTRRVYVPVSDIEKILSYDEVVGIFSNENYDGVGNDVQFGGDRFGVIAENYGVDYLGCSYDSERKYEDICVYGSDRKMVYFQGRRIQNEGYSEEIIGDLIFGSEYTHTADNPTGYFVISDSEILWTLSEAIDKNLLRIGMLASEMPYVYLIGDADYDYKITVKDATMIQKLLAGIKDYKDVVCVSRPEDKDRDGRVTIKDATAIQKQITGLVF